MPEQNRDEKLEYQRRTVEKIELLPSIPLMLQKIIATSSDPNASAHDLQETIIRDQSISAAILKLANSAFYGYSRSVDDIGKAIVIIGFNTAVSIATSVSILKSFSKSFSVQEFDKESFWMHTVATGEAARLFAQQICYEPLSRAYIIGLLHDIGKVVLSCVNSTDFDDAVFESRAFNKPLIESERQYFGFDHQTAGGWLGERWHLPEGIVAGIQYHHDIDQCPEPYRTEAVISHVANYIALSLKLGKSGDEYIQQIHPAALSYSESLPDSIDFVKQKLEKQRAMIEKFFQSIL